MKKTEQNKPLIPSYETETETAENITIEINEPKHNFIIVYDTIYRNNDLSATEKGLLLNLLSIAPTFKPSRNGLIKISKIGRETYDKAIKSLQEKGYIKIERKGKNEYKYIVNQTPQLSDQQLSYEYLKKYHTFDAQLWNTLLNNRKINLETYNKLVDNLKRIVNIEWIRKD